MYELCIIPIITRKKFGNKYKENFENKIFEYSESKQKKKQKIVEYAYEEIIELLSSLYEEAVQTYENDFKNHKNTLDKKYSKLKKKVDTEVKNARVLNGLKLYK